MRRRYKDQSLIVYNKKKNDVSEAGSASVFRPGVHLTSSYSQSLGITETLNLLRYAPETRSSPRVVTRKMLQIN